MAQKLFIGGLSFNTSTDRLRELFAQVEGVESVSVVNDRYESNLGRWSEFAIVGANRAYPTLTVPPGPDGTLKRRIYRQFRQRHFTCVGEIPDNKTTTFIDKTS